MSETAIVARSRHTCVGPTSSAWLSVVEGWRLAAGGLQEQEIDLQRRVAQFMQSPPPFAERLELDLELELALPLGLPVSLQKQ